VNQSLALLPFKSVALLYSWCLRFVPDAVKCLTVISFQVFWMLALVMIFFPFDSFAQSFCSWKQILFT
jgi:hypothetical protein